MTDPVWLGNHIVPRWEALALGFGGIAALMLSLGIVVGATIELLCWLFKKSRDAFRRAGGKSC